MAVLVQTTYSITPDALTIAGYITALEALKTAGVPATTMVTISGQGGLSVTVADRAVINAIADWVETQKPIQPMPVNG